MAYEQNQIAYELRLIEQDNQYANCDKIIRQWDNDPIYEQNAKSYTNKTVFVCESQLKCMRFADMDYTDFNQE